MKKPVERLLNKMCLMDDTFMTVAFDGDRDAVGLLVSIVLNRKINISYVQTQKTVVNSEGKKIIMDVFAMDDEDNVYVIEFENNPNRAAYPRLEYYKDMVSNIVVQFGTPYSKIRKRYVICFTRGDAAKIGQAVSQTVTKWKDTDKGPESYGVIIYVNVKKNEGDEPIAVLNRDLVQRDFRKIKYRELRECCRRVKEGEGKKIMCDKIRQMQATIREEERAKTAEMVTEARKEERAKAAKMVTEAREEERTKAAELVTEAREEEKAKAEQQRNAYLKLLIENHIPLEKICTILQMSVETVIQQAYMLGCVL